jgi:hypothetical protein
LRGTDAPIPVAVIVRPAGSNGFGCINAAVKVAKLWDRRAGRSVPGYTVCVRAIAGYTEHRRRDYGLTPP